MAALVIVLVALVVLIVTALGFAARGTRRAPATPVASPRGSRVDPEDVTEWVRGRLPADVGAVLSRDDVRRIIDWNLEYFRSRSTSGNGHGPVTGEPVVVAGPETVDHVLARAGSVGAPYTSAQVHAVLEAQMRYLESIGAAASEPDA